MAAANSNDWQIDQALKNDLNKYVTQGMQRLEILDYVKRDYSYYSWSLRTLDRRLRFYDIYYTDQNIPLAQARQAIQTELDGPGKLLGYRAMQLKIRQKYDLKLPRDRVHDLMFESDPDGLQQRRPGLQKKKKVEFTTKGTNWVLSLDGHDKLMGFQNWIFPLAVYGCMDTASRKMLWLRVWTSNSKPEIIGKWYLEYLFESRKLACYLRMDRGTETGTMATMHSYLRKDHDDLEDPVDSVLYGPSTSNQIERWWKELHERLEKYFKKGLSWLKEQHHYNPHSKKDRDILSFVMIPIIQNQLNEFKDIVWNPHRIRLQKDTFMPDGIPNHIYDFPEKYGLEDCALSVTENDLRNVARLSNVLSYGNDYLTRDFRAACEMVIENPVNLAANKYVEKYLHLKYSMEIINYKTSDSE